jgi:hypothetical protein
LQGKLYYLKWLTKNDSGVPREVGGEEQSQGGRSSLTENAPSAAILDKSLE